MSVGVEDVSEFEAEPGPGTQWPERVWEPRGAGEGDDGCEGQKPAGHPSLTVQEAEMDREQELVTQSARLSLQLKEWLQGRRVRRGRRPPRTVQAGSVC